MRLRFPLLSFLFFACAATVSAQVTLFSENFDNGCILPPGWQVNTIGNPNPKWYVGSGLQNNDENGLSMNGSCFLVIDDDATGDNTPAYVIDFVTPPFDATQFPTISLSVDVHYRDYAPANESFKILVTDGVNETLLRTFAQGGSTGDSLFEYLNVKFDLSFINAGPNTRIIFRYDDDGGFAWWAAIDNIEVVGSGVGQNVIKESFNGCQKPAGWETEVVTGDFNWEFGYVTNPKTTYAGTSMDGSCMAFFDDDLHGDSAAYSTVRMATPWFDGTQFARFELNFDIIMRYVAEKVSVFVQHGDGSEYLIHEAAEDVGGPHFKNYVHWTLDLSAHRSQQMRVIFEYDDGKAFGWWIGIDNVKITGNGVANDICVNAKPLYTGVNCLSSNNRTALFDGPLPDCIAKPVAGLWYSWKADFNGLARIETRAGFNDVVNVFTGDCSSPQTLLCVDRDEHGFRGEAVYFEAEAEKQYLIRVCGKENGFGVSRGDFCIDIQSASSLPPTPVNDHCDTALPLELNAPCLSGDNLNGATSATLPSHNELARADIWYRFTAPALAPDESLLLESNADFSDVMTLYSGDCSNLKEVISNHKGGRITTDLLQPGESYFLQISGNFATIEGHVCPQMSKIQENAPDNDLCSQAFNLTIDGPCTPATNIGATFSGQTPPCVVSVARDIWFKFIAPNSGTVKINTGADFPHIAAIWKGNCQQLNAVFCTENPLRCNGFFTVGGLSAGQEYYLQIATQIAYTAPAAGNVCLRILDGNTPPDFNPLSLNIEETCIDVDMAKIRYELSGGVAPFTAQGAADQSVLPSGAPFFVVVTDASGCETSFSGKVGECSGNECTLAAGISVILPKCAGSADGTATAVITGGQEPLEYHWSNGAGSQEIGGLSAGFYSVTILDALGCEFTQTVELTEPAPLLIGLESLTQPHGSNADGAIQLTVTGGVGALQFEWYKDGVFFASGLEDLIGVQGGAYQLHVTDVNGCTAALDVQLDALVGAQEPSGGAFIEVFPNPAASKTTLTVSFPQPRDVYFTLSDASGKSLRTWTEKDVSEQTIPLDVNHLASGAYQIRMVTDSETLVETFVVQR